MRNKPNNMTVEQAWDYAIENADREYKERMHSIFCDNCHSHVALAMNNMNYRGRKNRGMVSVWWQLLCGSWYLTWCKLFSVYMPFVIVFVIILALMTIIPASKPYEERPPVKY